MATKTKEKYYCPIEVYREDYPGCCGIEVFSGLDLVETFSGYMEKKTKEEVFEDLWKQIKEERTVRHVQVSFVTKYQDFNRGPEGPEKGQCPGLKEFLLKNKWYIIDEFKAPRHGNTVCVMGHTFRSVPKRNLEKEYLYW